MLIILPTHNYMSGTPPPMDERACVVFEASAGELAGWLRLLTKVHELSDELGRDVVIPLEEWAIPAVLVLPQAVPAGRFVPAQRAPGVEKHVCHACTLHVSKEALQLVFSLAEDTRDLYAVWLSRRAIQRLCVQAVELEAL
jgi:hypothetical protein